MAAETAFGIIKNHPFADGNKRTALASALVFLWKNGARTELPGLQAVSWVLGLESGGLSREGGFASRLRDCPRDAAQTRPAGIPDEGGE